MNCPDDLPHVLYYRMRTERVILTALPRKPVRPRGTNGESDAALVRPRIPYGATAWSTDVITWRPLAELPKHWLPFVDSPYRCEKDYRDPPERRGQR